MYDSSSHINVIKTKGITKNFDNKKKPRSDKERSGWIRFLNLRRNER